MIPIFAKDGGVIAWLNGSRIIGLRGESVAWVRAGDNIYNYSGQHLGWWRKNHIQGRNGGVAGWIKGASDLGVILPVASIPPIPPIATIEPIRPIPQIPPIRPMRRLSYSDWIV